MKNIWKAGRSALAVLSAAVLAMPMGAAVSAEENELASIIDVDRTGSITINKLKDNSDFSKEGNGSVDPTVTQPGMEGIEFTVLKIADIETAAYDNSIGTYYTNLDAGFAELLSENHIQTGGKEAEGRIYYTAGELSAMLNGLNHVKGTVSGETKVINYVKDNSHSIVLKKTDKNGTASVSGLPLGVYLTAETDYSAYVDADTGDTIYNPSSPFLVSIPMTNQDENTGIQLDGKETKKGTAWQYDVVVYPKNQTVSIHKYIVSEADDASLVESDDHEIGEEFRQVISSAAPAAADGHLYEKYVVTDTMEAGLNMTEVVEVRLGDRVASPESVEDFQSAAVLVKDTDYKIECSSDRTEFSVVFLKSGLEKLNARTANGQVTVVFKTILTSEASDGNADPNTNQPKLICKNQSKEEHTIIGNIPKVYAYRLHITKKGVSDASRVFFSVYKGETELVFVHEGSGIYHLFDNDDDQAKEGKKNIAPAADGTLILRGLDADTYQIVEKATESGHELLKNRISVTLNSLDEENGKLAPDGNLANALLTAGDTSMQISVDKGTAGFTVKNDSSISLKTGGMGRTWFYLVMGACIVSGIFMSLLQRKKNRAQ
ncbi:MAG: SpaH/EbpB family LPXTG-anchored major pilin [Eubacteriales bacterium]|nr:SpaH/EbpB family LPXTG-anchored major pilin [Eubacteriales bacterium]